MAHVAPYKKQLVEDLASRCAQAQVVGIVNVHGIPAPQFQAIRKKLWGRATITVAKNNLLRLALEQANAKKPDLVRAGQRIPRDVAQQLARLEIYPLVVGLDLRGAYEAGTVFRRDALAIDDLVVRSQIAQAGREALALALAAAYPTKQTIGPLLARAHAQALNLSVESEFPTKETIKLLLVKAQSQALALASRAPGAHDQQHPTQPGSS